MRDPARPIADQLPGHQGFTSKAARAEQKATLLEALELNESLAEQLNAKLARMDSFRAKVAGDAERCRELLAKFEMSEGGGLLGHGVARRIGSVDAWSAQPASTKSRATDSFHQPMGVTVPRIEPIPLDELAEEPRRIIEDGVADGTYATPIPLQIFAYRTSQILVTHAARGAWGQQSLLGGRILELIRIRSAQLGRVPTVHAVPQARLDHRRGRGLPHRPGRCGV